MSARVVSTVQINEPCERCGNLGAQVIEDDGEIHMLCEDCRREVYGV